MKTLTGREGEKRALDTPQGCFLPLTLPQVLYIFSLRFNQSPSSHMSILPLVIKSHRGLVFSGRVLGALRAYSSSNETSQLGSVGQRIQSRLSEKFGSSNLQVINPSYPSESHFTWVTALTIRRGRSEPLIPLVLFYRIKVISKEFAEKVSVVGMMMMMIIIP